MRARQATFKPNHDGRPESCQHPPMTLDRYDPHEAPDPEAWLALSEEERLFLILDWHETTGQIGSNNRSMHASFHKIVENQVAERNPPLVAIRLRQLIVQGLDRHDAIHAIISCMAKRLASDMKRSEDTRFNIALYEAALRRLNAKSWLRSG